jgi:hypothetical protein
LGDIRAHGLRQVADAHDQCCGEAETTIAGSGQRSLARLDLTRKVIVVAGRWPPVRLTHEALAAADVVQG